MCAYVWMFLSYFLKQGQSCEEREREREREGERGRKKKKESREKDIERHRKNKKTYKGIDCRQKK